jgi:hypothetical protein
MMPQASAIGMNSLGGMKPRPGCGQRSSASSRTGLVPATSMIRLVVEAERAFANRPVELALERVPASDLPIGRRVEYDERAAAGAPRLVERRIALAEQALCAFGVARRCGNAQRHGDEQPRTSRSSDAPEDALGNDAGILGPCQMGDQHREHVAVESGREIVRPDHLLQPEGNLLEHRTTDRVPEGIVDLLEVVDVGKDQCDGMSLAPRGRERRPHALHDRIAIGETRE